MARRQFGLFVTLGILFACGGGGGVGTKDQTTPDRADTVASEEGEKDVPGQEVIEVGGEEAFQEVPQGDAGAATEGPCSKELNPECKPETCKLDDGTEGTCGKDEEGRCVCVAVGPAEDPCGPKLNPQCEPRKCPVAPNVDGLCAIDPATNECKCGGGQGEDPCGTVLNPKCEAKDCKLPDGTSGKCKVHEDGSCGCEVSVPQGDPCGEELNPECKQATCDDGNKETVKDLCRWVVEYVGGAWLDSCKCVGEFVTYDPCDLAINPECKPAECKLASGEVGKCQKDEKLGCACKPEVVPIDPCGKDLNPKCEPKDCPLPDGSIGECKLDGAGQCGCSPIIVEPDPCGKVLNPECKQVECDDQNPQTVKDVCRWVEDPVGNKYCKCVGEFVTYDPCDLAINPECKPAECKLADGQVGKCQKDEKLGCACKPEVVPGDPCSPELNPKCEPVKCQVAPNVDGICTFDPITEQCKCGGGIIPEDPCGPLLNPQCKAVACDDGNPLTVNDRCQWVKDPLGISYCACLGDFGLEDPCSPFVNPTCKPVACKTPKGLPGKCQSNDIFGCACEPIVEEDPCGSVINPKCEPTKCDDGNPATENDMCRFVVSPLGLQTCTCLGEPSIFDPCDLFFNPTCKPQACVNEKGLLGKCGWTAVGECGCLGGIAQCEKDQDCLVLDWLVDCAGHWDCVDGLCKEVCGKPCGDGICQPGQGEGPATCPSDCKACKENVDCAKTEFCKKADGDCDGLGTCSNRPTTCPLYFDPVCGCDGNTYINSCEAHLAGVNVWYHGMCTP